MTIAKPVTAALKLEPVDWEALALKLKAEHPYLNQDQAKPLVILAELPHRATHQVLRNATEGIHPGHGLIFAKSID